MTLGMFRAYSTALARTLVMCRALHTSLTRTFGMCLTYHTALNREIGMCRSDQQLLTGLGHVKDQGLHHISNRGIGQA